MEGLRSYQSQDIQLESISSDVEVEVETEEQSRGSGIFETGYQPEDINEQESCHSIWDRIVDMLKFTFVVTPGGNQGRDNLSNERTVLAYIRTGVNFITVGIAVLQLFKYVAENKQLADVEHDSDLSKQLYTLNSNIETIIRSLQSDVVIEGRLTRGIGFISVVFGLIVLLFGWWRYTKLSKLVNSLNKYETGSFEVIIIGSTCMAISILVLTVLIKW